MLHNKLLNIVSKHYLIDENIYLLEILRNCCFSDPFFKKIEFISNNLTNESRKYIELDNIDNILNEYNLSTKEGIQMMCLAESLLRIPDFYTSNSFIKDKISFQEWDYYYGSDYWKITFYNMIIELISNFYYKNKIVSDKNFFIFTFKKMVVTFSNYVMKNIGRKFVYSNKIFSAIKNASFDKNVYSFDMLGEAALTFYDARKFFNQYNFAIYNIKRIFSNKDISNKTPTVSIKLSALHPKYSFFNRKKVLKELVPLLKTLIINIRESKSLITIDAEESDRLELSLMIFNKLFYDKCSSKWERFGLVVQTYSKRALPILYWLKEISIETEKKIPIRLVKGAYWDYEIKYSQFLNLNLYPVYTKKFCTDLSYLLCTMFLLSSKCRNILIPQFATHNIQTIAFILALNDCKEFEFQKLYGMGNDVYYALYKVYKVKYREYAPIGAYKELLPYLVRRLLENGANSSFVNKILNKNKKNEELLFNPLFNKIIKKYNSKIPLPIDLFGGSRNLISFFNLNISFHLYNFFKKIKKFDNFSWVAYSFSNKKTLSSFSIQPSNKFSINGIIKHDKGINQSIRLLNKSFSFWNSISIQKKIKMIKNFISLLKENFLEIIVLCCREAGKTILDSISDIKEAIDFCKYYTNQAFYIKNTFYLPNFTGENNIYLLEGKGIISTISPWNFPVAIFCGQIIAALLSGNVVLAKPAESTSLIAHRIFQLMYKSGIPISVLQIIIGSGSNIGNKISFNKNVNGIIFTGSNDVANTINRNLIMREKRPISKIIAETGGLNIMIADSSALIEQLIIDVIESSFKSCGQRCSALRLLYINENIYLETIKLLFNCLNNLEIGDPIDTSTDIGPIISKRNLKNLINYIKKFNRNECYYIDKENVIGNFLQPVIIRINGIKDMKSEQFGPILHIAIYKNEQLNSIIEEINSSEFGLTFGIHSRNEAFYKYLANKINVGNIYINRNTIGAMVGMQPFGGCNLSGTGPKAGGNNYLLALVNEKTITINTTAQGGNVDLLNL